jgi:hypothetical protein
MPTGYSGKPLYEKLGIKAGHRVCVLGAPADYETLLEGKVPRVEFTSDIRNKADVVHVFETKAAALRKRLPALQKVIAPAGMIWVSWPKKTARVDTDITEDVVRNMALALDLVDVKVCAVNDVWSGLKLVIRRERR